MIEGTREGADAVPVTPIFDDLAAAWEAAPPYRVLAPARRPSPRPRAEGGPTTVVGADAFGRGCLETRTEELATPDDEVTRLLEGARREAVALGRGWVDTVHLVLAAVRAGGDVGRVFGLRGAGPAVLLAALDDEPGDRAGGDDPTGGDPVRPALSSVARTVLHRAAHRAARENRAVTAAELAAAVARTGRVADLLAGLGVDLEDLADALSAVAGPAEPDEPMLPTSEVAPVTVLLALPPATPSASPRSQAVPA